MQCIRPIHWFRLTIFVFVMSLIASCGTGDGEDSLEDPVQTGFLIDSGVEGVLAETASQSVITDDEGVFKFEFGEMVTFSIGDIELGTVKAKGIITPVELTGSSSPTDQAAINMAVLLQSLDADLDPTNGIFISFMQ